MPEITGIDFDRAWRRRVMQVVDAQSGLTVPYISADDLIVAKLAAGRMQDLADVVALQAARRGR